jgi:Flp pilus assembly protein TadD
MDQVYTIVMMAFIGLVLTTQTAYGVGVDLKNDKVVADNNPPGVTNETNSNTTNVIRLQNGPMEPNTLGIGAPDSTGVTMLPNGTFAAYVNGAVGSTIGPVHVTRYLNGNLVGSADFHIGSKPSGNESDANATSTGNESKATINVGPPVLDLTNTTWTIYNATSGSIGTITFKAYAVETGDEKGSLSTNPPPTYIRHLHGRTLEGTWRMGTEVGQALELCSFLYHGSQSGCTDLTITTLSPNHIELQDSHGDTIRLMRNGMPQIANSETDCSRTDLTQYERYTCGYNHGYLDAHRDWNLHRFPPQSGGDSSCPHATEHTPEYCNGYAKGYTYQWNTLISTTQSQPPSIQTQTQNTTTPTGPSLDTLYNKGLSLYHLGNYTGAIEYFDKALAINPHDVDALNGKGVALDHLGNYTGAIEYYDKVLAIDPQYAAALNNKGAALTNLGNYTGAIEHFDKALAIDPQYVDALNSKGKALDNLGNNTGAILYYDKALAIDAQYVHALVNKGGALMNLGNNTGAIPYFDKALAINPDDVDALNKYSVSHNVDIFV